MPFPIENEHDYYRVLGVVRAATSADISAAYHLLAHRYHPDVSSASDESLARLKLINEAYEVLSDADKRQAYDLRRPSRSVVESAARTWSPFVPARCAQGKEQTRSRSHDIELELPIAPEEARQGGPCEFTLSFHQTCDGCAGQGQIAGSWCGTCGGQGRMSRQRRLQILLPAGMRDGTIIRFVGHGGLSPADLSTLLLRIKVQPCW
jgi:molecular chaperone DnaJ